jgi:hypothetical protein
MVEKQRKNETTKRSIFVNSSFIQGQLAEVWIFFVFLKGMLERAKEKRYKKYFRGRLGEDWEKINKAIFLNKEISFWEIKWERTGISDWLRVITGEKEQIYWKIWFRIFEKTEREWKCVVDPEMEQRESSKREALMEINLHYIIEKEKVKTQKSKNLAMGIIMRKRETCEIELWRRSIGRLRSALRK